MGPGGRATDQHVGGSEHTDYLKGVMIFSPIVFGTHQLKATLGEIKKERRLGVQHGFVREHGPLCLGSYTSIAMVCTNCVLQVTATIAPYRSEHQ